MNEIYCRVKIKTMILRSCKRIYWLNYKKNDKIEIFCDKKSRWVWNLSLYKELINVTLLFNILIVIKIISF